ncbi:MAG: GNAT family N-acetyltransferase [Pseudonocardia sp.]
MTAAPPRNRLVELGAGAFADRLGEALDIYVAAMGYAPSTARARRTLWLDHARRPGWRAVGWVGPAGELLAVAYGYHGGPGQWWFEEVRRGLRLSAPDREGWLSGYFELTELHVRPDAQGGGLGEGLLRTLLAGADQDRVLLSTPEHRPRPPSRAWRLYRRLGFVDVLRQHRFTGDSRPFAVLGRSLPLDAPAIPVPVAVPRPPGMP